VEKRGLLAPATHSSRSTARPTSVAAHPSLEYPAFLDGPEKKYVCSLYPEAGEASIVRLTHPEKATERRPARDPDELEQEREQEAVRRARANVRRYIRANRCRILGSVTFAAEVRDLDEAWGHANALRRRLREKYGRFPFLIAPEPQPRGHAWHFHFCSQRKLPHKWLERAWGQGWVWLEDGKRYGLGRATTKDAARYMSKYLGKQMAGDLPEGFTGRRPGQHRYRLTEGFKPACFRNYAASDVAAYEALGLLYGDHDYAFRFAVVAGTEPDSWWLAYPDKCLHPPPRLD
jgi:hypothetical protein